MAAVTFSGFNSIDFNQVVSAIIEQERQPLRTLETQKTTLQTQNTAFGNLAGRLTAIQSAIDTLASDTGVGAVKATSSDTSVGVATSASSVEGSYDIVVSTVARRQVTASSTTYASTDEVVATGGALTLTGADGTTATIAVDALMTVKELVDAINASNDAPVTASLVQSTPGSYQIVLTGKRSGSSNAFTASSSLTGGSGLQFGSNVQNAVNATFTVNGLAITSATNTITDVVPGATLTLTKQDPDKTVTVTVSRDTETARARVEKLVTAYNDLMSFVNDQRTAATNGNPSIARDPLVQHLRNSLRTALMSVYDNDGDYSRLAEIGLGFDRTGKMVLDEEVFNEAIEHGVSDVQSLLSGDDGSGGAFGAVKALIKGYTRAGGLVADVRERLSTQMQSLASRIDSFEEQLERRRLTLQKEFQAADEAISQMNAQVSSLSALGGQYRLF
ncbi:MAG TPA: flagellar filament capping protein FliD [Vicinamibacterales bacterium]|nr:flagellar filament capping protein FliD [Vicinamibacterales bacterium]